MSNPFLTLYLVVFSVKRTKLHFGIYYFITEAAPKPLRVNLKQKLLDQVGENKFSERIKLAPNPLSSFTILETEEDLSDCIICIYSCSGEKVKELKNISGNSARINRDNLAPGVYFMKLLKQEKTIDVKKIIIFE